MPVSGPGSIRESPDQIVNWQPVGASIKGWIQKAASSRRPFSQAFLFKGGDCSVAKQPKPIVGVVQDRINGIGFHALLGAYREDTPALNPTQAACRADP